MSDSEASSTQAKLVLVIEENVAICDMLCWALENATYRTATLASWQDAYKWAENALQANELPLLILLDLSNPLDIDAPQVLQHLRTQLKALTGTTPPIIVLTTFEKVYSVLLAAEEAVIRKPFHMSELFGAIQKVLSPPSKDS